MGHLLVNETREVKKRKMDAGGVSLFWKGGVPFSDEIMSDEAPTNVCSLNFEYDGSTDPWYHLARFECFDLLYRYSDGVKCRIFATTLSKSAQRWFAKLPAKSVRNFDEFSSAFMKQFMVCRRTNPNASLLLSRVKQREGESLRNYLNRFTAVAVKAIPVDEDALKSYLIEGLQEHDDIYSYVHTEKPNCTLGDLLGRIESLCFLEEEKKHRNRDGC